jgi:hypothetical protein
MTRFYFHIKEDATLIADLEGDNLPDEGAAFSVIREAVDDIVTRPEAYGGLKRWTGREFIVTDESGDEVLAVPISTLIRRN